MKLRNKLEKLNFMIADDNAFMRTTIRHILESFGVQRIKEAPDSADALKIIKDWSPDIMLMEWDMTPLNGAEVARMVRSSPSATHRFIPIIMLTAYSEQWRIAEARDAGVTEYLVKPVSANTVLSHIRATIEQPRPFVKSEDYFGPDRRRHLREYEHECDRRTAAPTVVPYRGILSQSFLQHDSSMR